MSHFNFPIRNPDWTEYKITHPDVHMNVTLRAKTDAGAFRQAQVICRQTHVTYSRVIIEKRGKDFRWVTIKNPA